MYKPVRAAAFSVILLAALTACGGGGSGGGVREVPFTSFHDVQPDQRVVMPGISETMTGNVDVNGNVSNITPPGVPDEASSSVSLTYDSSRNLSQIDISTPGTRLSAGNVACSSGVCTAENATAAIIAIDATAFGWNYQSYGVWTNDTGPTSLQAGAMSAGAVTPGSAVPLQGSATFNGATSAFFVDTNRVPFFTTAVMSADVNFGGQSIAFTSTGTQAGNLVTGSIDSRPDLDLSGNLSYTRGINRFAGTLSTTSNPAFLTGQATGRFYGPAAQEMGGTYNLSGAGGRMLGAFGGKQ